MRVTLELSADELRVLQEISEAAGVTLDAVLHGLIAQVSPPEQKLPEQKLPAASTPPADLEALHSEILAEQKREQEEMEANVKRWHAEQAQT